MTEWEEYKEYRRKIAFKPNIGSPETLRCDRCQNKGFAKSPISLMSNPPQSVYQCLNCDNQERTY